MLGALVRIAVIVSLIQLFALAVLGHPDRGMFLGSLVGACIIELFIAAVHRRKR